MSRGLALARALGALVLLVALVVGVPVLLIATVGNPFPSSMPSLDEIRVLLTQNGDGFAQFLQSALAVLIWFIWVQLIAALVAEILAVIRNGQTPRLPTLPGIQLFAARLVATITLATTLTAGPMLAPAVGALSFGSVDSVADGQTAAYVQSTDDARGIASAARDVHGSAHETISRSIASDAPTVTLAEHTELWDLADAAYGDGVAWKLIAQTNAGLIDANGSHITDQTEALPPGTSITLPGGVDLSSLARFGSVVQVNGDQAADDQAADGHHVVEAGDSMWSVAAQEVGDRLDRDPTDREVAEYWVDVVDANRDVSSGDPDLIYPGEELAMPGRQPVTRDGSSLTSASEDDAVEAALDAVVASDAALGLPEFGATNPAASSTSAAPVTSVDDAVDGHGDSRAQAVEAPDTAASNDLAPLNPATQEGVEDAIEDPAASRSSADAGPVSNSTGDSTAGSESVVRSDSDARSDPGSELGAGSESEADDGDDADRDEDATPVRAMGLAAFGAAILSAGVVDALRRRRDLQRRLRPAGAIAPPPSTSAAAFEAAMHHASTDLRLHHQGPGWQALPAATVEAARQAGVLQIHAEETGELRAVSLTDEANLTVEPLVPEPDPDAGDAAVGDRGDATTTGDITDGDAAVGDRGDATTTGDTTDGDATIDLREQAGAVAPTTLIVGTDPTSGEAILLDLASSRRVCLQGPRDAIERFARNAVLDLAVSDRADDLTVIAINTGTELCDLERAHMASDFADALARAISCGASADDDSAVVVISAAAPAAADHACLRSLDELGVNLLAPNIDAPTQIELAANRATIMPTGTLVAVAALGDDDYRSVAELVEATSLSAVDSVDESIAVEERIDVLAVDVCAVEAGPVEVRVLGPVDVAGASRFSSLKAVDVICYLAFHRHGVDADQIKTWVWPTFEPPTDKAFANVMSRARTGLGSSDEGAPYLSRAGADKTYRLSAEVSTDYDRFRAIVALADQAQESGEQTQTLKLLMQALELIRGVPFTGGGASNFVWADNHVRAQVEFTIDETVHRCADLALQLDDLATARWAALKGLELVPGCEECFRRRFLVAGAGNNRSELRRAMADLERTASAELGEPEAVDTISGELLDLYHELDRTLIAGMA